MNKRFVFYPVFYGDSLIRIFNSLDDAVSFCEFASTKFTDYDFDIYSFDLDDCPSVLIKSFSPSNHHLNDLADAGYIVADLEVDSNE